MPPLTICHCELGHSESLGLIIVGRRVKPAVMKTLYRTLAFVVLAVIAVVTLIGCPPKHAFTEQKFALVIAPYAEVADEGGFKKALKTIKDKGGVCDIKFLPAEGATLDKEYCKHLDVSLRTDKVTKSEVVTRAAAGEAMANDPHASYKVQSANPEDIIEVLKTLKK
jgi:hypothetical protein